MSGHPSDVARNFVLGGKISGSDLGAGIRADLGADLRGARSRADSRARRVYTSGASHKQLGGLGRCKPPPRGYGAQPRKNYNIGHCLGQSGPI